MAQLTRLQLLLPVGDTLQVHPEFRRQLQAAVCGMYAF